MPKSFNNAGFTFPSFPISYIPTVEFSAIFQQLIVNSFLLNISNSCFNKNMMHMLRQVII